MNAESVPGSILTPRQTRKFELISKLNYTIYDKFDDQLIVDIIDEIRCLIK